MINRAFTATVLAFLLASPALALTTKECLDCHDDFTTKASKASVHGDMDCTDCHEPLAKAKGEHDTPVAKVKCDSCHDEAAKVMETSAHSPKMAKNQQDLPGCASCHGTHDILPKSNVNSRVYALNVPATCCQCHGSRDIAARHVVMRDGVCREYEKSSVCNDYEAGMHGQVLFKCGVVVSAVCSRCHGSHDIKSTTDETSPVNPKNVNKTCGSCHMGVYQTYVNSVHGQRFASGDVKAPVCTNCHAAHRTARALGSEFDVYVAETCTACHAAQGVTFRDTYHGQVTGLGYAKVAQCSDCHGAHNILPKEDPASKINPANLVKTCGSCHPGAGESFVQYLAHMDYRDEAKYPLYYYIYLFMVVLLAGVFIFFGIHTVLWFIRTYIERLRHQ